jgi:TonB-linked SusC/RagA family outer membrane protein
VSGRVTSAEDGTALPGVNVVVKGTTNGTVTDADGNYKLSVPSAQSSLVFSFIGLKTSEVVIGERTTVDVALSLDVTQLSEVVVTAQGIQREQKALGYATTTISSAVLAEKPETDIGRALQGRTPGIQILNSSGIAGSGSRVNIRGNSSLTGDTQPLWIVDGVPINTQSNDINSDFRDGQVAPTRFLDIDPNNIESISILRGLSASVTYGSQGRNGVILVTTKTGAGKGKGNRFQGSIAQSYYAVEAIIPEYQNKWANGFDGAYGEFFSNWGSLFDGNPVPVRHPYFEHAALFPEFPEFQQGPGQYIPVAQPNNVKDFFQRGHSATTSLSLGGSNEFGSLNFSYSRLDEAGFIANNNLSRNNFSLGGSSKLTKKLTLNGSFNYVITDFQTPPSGAGTGSNSEGGPAVFAELFYTPRNIDLTNWPFEHPVTKASVYYRNNNSITNPYWTLKNARQTSLTRRFFSSSSLNYQLADWVNVTYRLGVDTYSEEQKYWVNKGGVGFDANLTPGAYRTVTSYNTIYDHSLLVSMNKQLTQDLDLSGLVGWNYRANEYNQMGLESLGQVVYGFLEHRNFTSTQARTFRGNNLNFQSNSAIAGVFFEASLGYKDYLYLNLKGRNDWSSTLEKDNRSLFYPGVDVAFVPTVLFPDLASNVLDFLKFRVAYGTSANFGTPYNTRAFLTLNSQARQDALGNVVTSRLSSLLANPNLKPELLTETEFGIEAKFLDERLALDFTLYNKISDDQIIERPLDPSTGYNATFINAGKISNKGIELGITGTPLKVGDWSLSINANLTRNRTMVESLPEGSKEIALSGFSNLGNFAIEGQPMYVIKGTYVERAPDGQLIINSNGSYQEAASIGIIADPNPDWLGSFATTLRWKSLEFGMQWDYVHGGQMFSYTAATMIGRGVAKDLEGFDPTLPLILPGVVEVFDEDGNVTGYAPNTIPLTTSGVFFGNTIIGGSPDDRGVYDATRVRFREISLTYNLPKSLVSKLKLNGINVSLIGNNLWFRAINAPKYAKADFDRTAFGANNGAGFDFLGGPSARRYGVNVKISF